MRILIAEAKTMGECSETVPAQVLSRHTPLFDSIATDFMSEWYRWDTGDIAAALKISPSMAANFKRMAYEFPDKHTGRKALPAFTGIVFKAFNYDSLSVTEQQRADEHINIISSLYGWLRGDDIVKPYRMDFTTRMAPDGESMCNFWKPQATDALLQSMRASGDDTILDLLPANAAKCLDWKAIKREFKVIKVDFRSVSDGGKLRTPHSTLLKTLRGRLLREIILQNINSADALRTYESSSMYVDPDSTTDSDTITVLVADR